MKHKPFQAGPLGKQAILGEVTVSRVANDVKVPLLALDSELVGPASSGEKFDEAQNRSTAKGTLELHFTRGGFAFA